MSGTRILCCHVTTATISFAVLYLIGNVLKMVGIMLTVSLDKEAFSVPYHESKATRGQRVFDISTNILMLVLMSISAVLVLFSKRKGPMFVLPFVLMMFVELSLSFLCLFDGAWGLPGTPNYRDMLRVVKGQKRVDSLNEEEIGQFTMSYSVLYMMYILLKVYVLHVSTRCFYALKAESMAAVSVDTGNTVTVKLPSYDEALKMRAENTPPSYYEA
ncbi:lysosomal-associated transmembrane protein 5-like [Sinocyclocheilus anshuiensis]|uniref:Lysosomal-associated transmembrane protein 5-like n=1 Tax=Sinocyclocheilus anshuiensis TaxID=1608454 RepID=A0A671LVB4_9TELE|nr:PREDICTED: lysosomal-associated transmembrane protein 5-like [Sinocyclocheilus anshuiensis]